MQKRVYFISSGEKNKMYTLRYFMFSDGEMINRNPEGTYVKTLSNDETIASIKAEKEINKHKLRESENYKVEFAGFGVEYLDPIFRFRKNTISEVDSNEQREAERLQRVKKQEELEEQREEERLLRIRQREHQEEQKRQKELMIQSFFEEAQKAIDKDIILFGKFKGYSIKELTRNYFKWLSEFTSENFEINSAAAAQMKLLGERKIPEKAKSEKESTHVGNVGDKIENLIVECEKSFWTSFQKSYYLTIETKIYIVTDEDGNEYKISYSGDKWSMDNDKKYKISGKIKGHGEYNGRKQTYLNYVFAEELNDELLTG